MEAYAGNLYAGMGDLFAEAGDDAEVWRYNGTTWTEVTTDGFDDSGNTTVLSLAGFGGYLYAGTINSTTGAQIWRCSTCSSAGDWTQVEGDGFGSTDNEEIDGLIVFGNKLYALAGNPVSGMEVWRTANGTDWMQVMSGGFGDPCNSSTFGDNGAVVHNNVLYIGTWNQAGGTEVWKLLPYQLYLPFAKRSP
jgi:hypothetical protein